ncbi:MAG TPA: protealysin inhibitor emfourin [Polyangiaceae bacterium]|nr:protealysin inhibitor emfourin [Polyangiaceae bacterium]
MKIELEVTGGFTGPAGKQTISVDTARLPVTDAAPLDRDLERLPHATWGNQYLKAHPKPWDFVHELRISDAGGQRSAKFHLDEGPPELSAIARRLTELSPSPAS